MEASPGEREGGHHGLPKGPSHVLLKGQLRRRKERNVTIQMTLNKNRQRSFAPASARRQSPKQRAISSAAGIKRSGIGFHGCVMIASVETKEPSPCLRVVTSVVSSDKTEEPSPCLGCLTHVSLRWHAVHGGGKYKIDINDCIISRSTCARGQGDGPFVRRGKTFFPGRRTVLLFQ